MIVLFCIGKGIQVLENNVSNMAQTGNSAKIDPFNLFNILNMTVGYIPFNLQFMADIFLDMENQSNITKIRLRHTHLSRCAYNKYYCTMILLHESAPGIVTQTLLRN